MTDPFAGRVEGEVFTVMGIRFRMVRTKAHGLVPELVRQD